MGGGWRRRLAALRVCGHSLFLGEYPFAGNERESTKFPEPPQGHIFQSSSLTGNLETKGPFRALSFVCGPLPTPVLFPIKFGFCTKRKLESLLMNFERRPAERQSRRNGPSESIKLRSMDGTNREETRNPPNARWSRRFLQVFMKATSRWPGAAPAPLGAPGCARRRRGLDGVLAGAIGNELVPLKETASWMVYEGHCQIP